MFDINFIRYDADHSQRIVVDRTRAPQASHFNGR